MEAIIDISSSIGFGLAYQPDETHYYSGINPAPKLDLENYSHNQIGSKRW